MRSRPELNPEENDLNLTPYLDVVMNLVVFLMASTIAVGSLRVIDVDVPAVCADCGGAAHFGLLLHLAPDGALISASDGSVAAQMLPRPYTPGALTDALASWKQRYQLDDQLTVSATPTMPYDAVVSALDAARQEGDQPLFPHARLAMP